MARAKVRKTSKAPGHPIDYRRSAQRLKIADNPTRLALLLHLADGESRAGAMSGGPGTAGLSAVPYHLAKLRTTGLVETHREGQHMVYRLTGAGRALADAARALTS
jgi:DNA-binding transcriptional ArsR family regulator